MTLTNEMKMPKTLVYMAIAAACAAALVGCGGGGGGSTPAAAPATPTPAPVSSGLVTSVAPASYTGDLASAFALLNAERQNCGFGLLAQSTVLDQAAAAHAGYSLRNNVSGHTEVAGQPGFTGVTPQDRATAAGYGGTASEAAVFGPTAGPVADVRLLLVAPYHLRGVLDGYRDVGLSNATNVSTASFVMDLGIPSPQGSQLLAGDAVVTYPCQGTTGVNRQLTGESPNPVPGRDLSLSPLGTPIFVKVRPSQVLTITSATLISVASGAPVALRAPVGKAQDPNGYFQANEVYIAPDAPLAANSQYQATIAGTNNGVQFSRTFSFTTGSN